MRRRMDHSCRPVEGSRPETVPSGDAATTAQPEGPGFFCTNSGEPTDPGAFRSKVQVCRPVERSKARTVPSSLWA